MKLKNIEKYFICYDCNESFYDFVDGGVCCECLTAYCTNCAIHYIDSRVSVDILECDNCSAVKNQKGV